jgi:hypothetical protein
MGLALAPGDPICEERPSARGPCVTEPLDALIRYRLERAQKSLADARLLADAARWHACVNRLYYWMRRKTPPFRAGIEGAWAVGQTVLSLQRD